MNTGEIKSFVLRQMRLRDGNPLTEQRLILSIGATFGEDLSQSQAQAVLLNMETEGLLSAVVDPILKTRSYTLTTHGQHAANKLK